MTNRNLLKAKVYEKGMTLESVAKAIGMEPSTLSRKVGGKRILKVDDVKDIALTLGLSSEEMTAIFYPELVDKKSTRGDDV